MITINDILGQWLAFKNKVNDYYTVINGAKVADVSLDGLDSTSKTSDFNLWMWIGAAVAVIVDGVQEERKAQIQAIADSAVPGLPAWFQKEVLKFQYGDALVVDPDTAKYSYAVIDATKQIIQRCAIVKQGSKSYVKVAKLAAGVPVKLAPAELVAFKSFLQQIEWPGMNLVALSIDSDLLNAPFTVYYNGIIPIADITAAVEAAYTNYLANLEFNGQYVITKHIDAIQSVPNVNDVIPGAIQAKASGGVYVTVNRIYNSASGYIQSDPALSLAALITYVAE